MIAYITIGADDIDLARRFYRAILPPLGYVLEDKPDGLSCALPHQEDPSPPPPEFYVKRAFDGRAASAGNGTMIAFDARAQAKVRALHAAGLAAGGTDEGSPGFRAAYSPNFYVAYLRDPQGNKIALFSSDPSEPGRDD